MTRAEKVAEAARLRAQGLRFWEICERMGAKRSTVSSWLNDPDLSKQKARRKTYAGECEGCGAPTDGSNGSENAPKYCAKCAPDAHRKWTEEAVLAAVHRFHDRYGVPPLAYDWHVGHPYCDRERFYRDADYPAHTTVNTMFGTFNAAIKAAGYEPCPVGHYAKNPRPGDLRRVAA